MALSIPNPSSSRSLANSCSIVFSITYHSMPRHPAKTAAMARASSVYSRRLWAASASTSLSLLRFQPATSIRTLSSVSIQDARNLVGTLASERRFHVPNWPQKQVRQLETTTTGSWFLAPVGPSSISSEEGSLPGTRSSPGAASWNASYPKMPRERPRH
jgi:hypothetical protein